MMSGQSFMFPISSDDVSGDEEVAADILVLETHAEEQADIGEDVVVPDVTVSSSG
jgi:hypothetical protein